ncbi:spermidine synthase [Peterkaempfera bronchialis]|uniref:Methyltransferase domain-containing protein n=1 Tax=Peterkaempfera bronchialis TaxID=2126346 RepID=A0A345SRT8_9ACTN|nr:fused MFS/spermidine synthase [Peterkaempfera bronchialis]AXI76443.1 methyltransferase domain-containing protein [Peterkaempfera bronchialis]
MADDPHDPHHPVDPRDEPIPVQRTVALGTARLLPDVDRPRARLLTLDGTPQSYVDLDDPTHLEFEYVRRLGHVVDTAAAPGLPLEVLHLGGGALALPRYTAATRPGSRQRVVEIDGPLLDLIAEQLPWQGPDARPETVVGDAREALAAAPDGSADLLLADVFGGSRVPAHLTTVEFVREAARVLRPGGLYAANLADGPPLDFARAQAATVRAVLPEVCLIAEPSVLRGRRFGNLVLVGSRRPIAVADLARRLAGDPFPARTVDGAALDRFIGAAAPVADVGARPSPAPPDGAFTLS